MKKGTSPKPYATDVVRDTLVEVWAGPPTVESLEEVFVHLRELCDRYPEGAFLYVLITAPTGMPGTESRALLERQFASMRGRLRAAVVVLEKSGIEGTLSRTILSTLLVITKKPFPMKVFAVREEAAQWLSSHPGAPGAALLVARAGALAARLGGERSPSLPPGAR